MLNGYCKNKETNVYARSDFVPIDYSDGDEVENRLLGIMHSVDDRSTSSAAFRNFITDWPTEYHLSTQRHCLLRPFPIKPGDNVLELGCGCGAITRFLGELGANVVAVEGSSRRAEVSAARCRDLPNVQVISEDLLKFECDEKFEWVLLIGVLEYAPLFLRDEDPVAGCLRKVERFVSETGQLVVAIENKLGLKYFNGCAEDHIGHPFYGLQNFYQPDQPRTFGRVQSFAKKSRLLAFLTSRPGTRFLITSSHAF